jgi:hypothetical protein
VLGDSQGVVSALECMGDRGRVPAGRKSRNLGRLWRLLVSGVAEVVLLVRPAVEETVETIEGGGEGVSEREGGAGGDGEPNMVVRVVVLREGRVRVESAVPKQRIHANEQENKYKII